MTIKLLYSAFFKASRLSFSTNTLQEIFPAFLFMISMICLPISHLQGLNYMPGDVGDARLNNFFLENIYLFLIGQSESLWHLPIVAPFPFVLGFSDNLFGSSPIYLLFRFLLFDSMTSFQLWFLFGYLFNFIASYWVLKKLGFNNFAAGIAAAFYSFALPTTAQVGHAQLQYRFGVPLAIYFFYRFLKEKNFSDFLNYFFWLTWQMYCTIYIGIFTILLSFFYVLSYAFVNIQHFKNRKLFFINIYTNFKCHFIRNILAFLFIIALNILLFIPYLEVIFLYYAHIDISETKTMLPRISSYLLCEHSYIWRFFGNFIKDIPMRHEHQIFIGFFPLFFLLYGILLALQKRTIFYIISSVALFIGMLLTLSIDNHSLYIAIAKLPLFNSTRAMTRIIFIFLIPIYFIIAFSIQNFTEMLTIKKIYAVLLISFIFICEISLVDYQCSKKSVWKNCVTTMEKIYPSTVSKNDILFFAQYDTPFWKSELDAMAVCQKYGVRTLNGYSARLPNGFNIDFKKDKNELKSRIVSYYAFCREHNIPLKNYHFIGIGFEEKNIEYNLFDVISKIQINTPILFNNSSIHRVFLGKGWSGSEIWGTWSEGKKAELKFPIYDNDLYRTLVIDANFLVNDKHGQHIEILINGENIYKNYFQIDSSIIYISIPEKIKKKDMLTITFKIPDAVSPKDLRMSGDDRKLGIGLKSITFK